MINSLCCGSLYSFFKRMYDLILAVFFLLVFFPVLFVIFFVIMIKFGSPVFFKQTRPGKHGVPFVLIKFRTMKNVRDSSGVDLPDKDRLTSFGSFLRSTSLDELPSLFNVIKGEMSLVGPRPLLLEYLPLYSSEQMRRHDVKPGLTGWAQINGRNAISWEDKFKLDTWYVDNRSIWLDLKIIYLTIRKVLVRDGISAEGEVTMQKFTGTPRE